MIRKSVLTLLILAVLFLPTGFAYADEIIRDGETVSTDLNLSDDLHIERGGTLDANAHILNGDAEIEGTINGNLLIIGGNVDLAESAIIHGDCVLLGGKVDDNASDTVCTSTGEFDFSAPSIAVANVPNQFNIASNIDSNGSVFGSMFGSVIFGLFAFAVAYIAPKQLNQIGDTITVKPVTSGTVGLLTFFGTFSVVILMTIISTVLLFVLIGILGFPIILAIMALLGLGLFLGWVAVGNIVGEIVADRLYLHKLSTPLTAALGTGVLSLAVGLIGLIPAIGFSGSIIWWLIGSIGLGAAALTRLGTRSYPPFAIRPDKLNEVLNSLDN